MKNLLMVITLLFLFSCTEKSENAVVAAGNSNVISNVESTKGSIYSKGSSLIDAVYLEMIKKDEALKSLDDEINSIGKRSNELILQKQQMLLLPL